MRLKGEMVIELTDTNTGAVETVQETNMITDAASHLPEHDRWDPAVSGSAGRKGRPHL